MSVYVGDEFPNQALGFDAYTDANAGTVNQIASPLRIGSATGSIILWSGTGVPTIGGNVGDLYIRQDGSETTYFYRCTVAGAAGSATWTAMSGA